VASGDGPSGRSAADLSVRHTYGANVCDMFCGMWGIVSCCVFSCSCLATRETVVSVRWRSAGREVGGLRDGGSQRRVRLSSASPRVSQLRRTAGDPLGSRHAKDYLRSTAVPAGLDPCAASRAGLDQGGGGGAIPIYVKDVWVLGVSATADAKTAFTLLQLQRQAF
jgi:hypothetical protein